MSALDIRTLSPDQLDENLVGLSKVLHACVHSGASVSFVLPFTLKDAMRFWTNKVRPALVASECVLFAAFINEELVGTVQLDHSMPPNQTHRCEVSKLLVRPDFHRRGIARKLMVALEQKARQLERPLITLDTAKNSNAQHLYESLGFNRVGEIPNFARHPTLKKHEATTYMYKEVQASSTR
ncbi:GNAT family N-acetyltransferase [Hirschia litorea]|uniref:GNAT family N-acetyltransferase n=1 Tax=Hirschia litorea TaxID=1199156 RepID=A0ABW2INF7_9PROT